MRIQFHHLCAAALISLVMTGCGGGFEAPGIESRPESAPARSEGNRVIYEVNVYGFSETHDFKGLELQLPRLKELGVDIVWLMPIHPRGEVNKSGGLGSPYGVRDYKAIYPVYGNEEDFRSLIAATHDLGMELWMDWVANHTSWDNAWISEHPEYYAEKNGVQPYSPPGWEDAAQLDHNCPGLVEAMADAMIYWVRDFGIDGFRCDAADFVPVTFWKNLRSKVDAVRKVTWLAEGSSPENMDVFDYDYAWSLADALMSFGEDRDVQKLKDACKALHRDATYAEKGRMTYITNHDLNAFNQSEFRRYPDNVMPLTVLAYTIFDLPLIYNGQEIGLDQSMSFSDDVTVDWSIVNSRFVELHRLLCLLKHSQPALADGAGRGALKIYKTNDPNLLVYSRKKGRNDILVALNLADYAIQCRITEDCPCMRYLDWMNDKIVEIDKAGFPLKEHGYAVFVR